MATVLESNPTPIGLSPIAIIPSKKPNVTDAASKWLFSRVSPMGEACNTVQKPGCIQYTSMTHGMPFSGLVDYGACRKEDPKIQQLVQGAFQWDWVHAHSARTHGGTCAVMMTDRPAVRTTKAADGHRAAAAQILAGHNNHQNSSLDSFKLTRFKSIAARTNTYRRVPVDLQAAA